MRRSIKLLGRARDGVAAVEFALLGSIFVVLLLNVVDFSLLIWSQIQVDYAAAAGAQAAYATCSPGQMPATSNCPTLNSVVTTAAQSTSLGSAVALTGNPSEAYFCTTGTSLQQVAAYPTAEPANCTAAGNPNATPGDYVTVNVSYNFRPLFAGLSLLSQHTLNATGMQRLQ